MSDIPLDTNVIIRYLVEDPGEIEAKFEGVYSFFDKIETGKLKVHVPKLVVFQAYFGWASGSDQLKLLLQHWLRHKPPSYTA